MSFLCSSEKELVSFFKEQVKLEERIVKSINQALETITNPVVKGVLKGISLDSLKHSEIYKAAIEVASVAPALSQEELDRLKEVVKRHVKNEERVIERLEDAVEKTKNEKVKFLLESIALDESTTRLLYTVWFCVSPNSIQAPNTMAPKTKPNMMNTQNGFHCILIPSQICFPSAHIIL